LTIGSVLSANGLMIKGMLFAAISKDGCSSSKGAASTAAKAGWR
jgi:hypothetical protein